MAPATWRVILNHYDPAPVSRLEHTLLLQRRSEPLPDDRTVVKRERARVGQEIPVPPSDGLLFVHLELRLRPLGVVSKVVLRVPAVTLDLTYAGGRTASSRITPATARNGLVVSPVPTTLDELEQLFLGRGPERPETLRISDSGAAYEEEVLLSWTVAQSPRRRYRSGGDGGRSDCRLRRRADRAVRQGRRSPINPEGVPA
jgi:hypothetical protein